MSTGNGQYMWQGSGQAVHDIKYTPGFDYALAAQPQVGWVVDDSAAHFHLHNPHFPGDRQQPNIPGPAVYMSDVLAAPTKPFQLPSIKLMSYVSCGLPGGRIAVHIKSPQDHSIISTFCFRIMFLDKLADTSLKYVARIGHDYRYALSAVVPESDTQLPYGVCSLKVAVADLAGRALEVLDVGKFTLKRPRASKATKTMKTTKKTSRKRQASETVNIAAVPPTKKVIASQDLSDQAVSQLPMDDQTHFWPGQQQFQQFQYTLNDGAHPSFDYSLQTLPSTLLYAQPPLGYGFVQSHSSPQHFQLSPEPKVDQSISPKTLHNVTVTPNEFDLDSPMPTSQPPTSRAISPCSEHPQLIRTTQLPSQRPFAEQAESLTEGKLLSINASLRIIGNVNSMLEDWTKEEKLTQRRLVEFERSQAGSVITVTFKQVPLSSRSNTNISVSCIWWERRGEAYITSVDTIRLLEHLVASRFNVQEKNRIRRNLEGYHPRTVAKGRPESDDFFKVVMGYGEPRPRVIEKDIKVFPWKSLNSMLNKVIGKYSADLTSTPAAAADSMLQPASTARSSISGVSNNDIGGWTEQQPSFAHAHAPTKSMQIAAQRPSHDWDTFPAIGTQSDQQQLLADTSFPSVEHSYYDISSSGLHSSSTYMPSIWDCPSAALTATPGSAYAGLPYDLFQDRMHYTYQQPDTLDSKI